MNDSILVVSGLIFGFITSIGLGPITVLVINRTFQKGRTGGFISGSGAAFSDSFYALIAGFSITIFIQFLENHRPWIQITVMIILILFGIGMMAFRPKVYKGQGSVLNRKINLFASSFLLALSNPLIIFVYLGVFAYFPQFAPETLKEGAFIFAGWIMGANLWWFTLTTIVRVFRKKLHGNRLQYINWIAGSLIILLGLAAGLQGMYVLITR